MRPATAKRIGMIVIAVAIGLAEAVARASGAPGDDPIAGLWEGRKVDGRYQKTEPWGPFLIERGTDGSLSATYLGSRLGGRDLPMYDVSLNGNRFHLRMSRRGGAVLEARLDPETGLLGTLRHHGMTEDLWLERIPKRTVTDLEALLESGEIIRSPPYQSEWMSVLIERGPVVARRLYQTVCTAHHVPPEGDKRNQCRLWGPSAVNAYGYELINRNRTAQAVEVFKLNALAYPDDANSFDSLGEAYMRNGDRELAIEAFRKSLALNPRPQVKESSIKLLRELGIDVYRD